MRKRNLIYLIIVLLFSCDNEQNLGNNYYYLPKYIASDVGYPYGSIIYRSTDRMVYSNILVKADVLSCDVKDDYIFIKQRPNSKLLKDAIKADLIFWNDYFIKTHVDSLVETNFGRITLKTIHNLANRQNKGITNATVDSLFSSSSSLNTVFKYKINYYIINKKLHTIDGPMDEQKFQIMKKQL